MYLDYKKPTQRPLQRVGAAELDGYARAGHFPPGNMGPKIESVLRFLRDGGKEAIITSCENLCEAVAGSAGTHIFPDRDRAEIERSADLENKDVENIALNSRWEDANARAMSSSNDHSSQSSAASCFGIGAERRRH